MKGNYHQPFGSQPWRFLWWLDDKAHAIGVTLPWVCERLDRELCGQRGR